ncbi:MAG TPA: substrate-binding domain-containing protein [Chitinophagaceae bacterium]|jgi:phosphate transport system substrate-binding protein|nr:substrate-binding domain-containing protein [Chitinophagaceae bacterium]
MINNAAVIIMKQIKHLMPVAVLFVLVSGCASPGTEPSDTRTSGTIHISSDESFKPVIDSQIKVFESLHPDAHIIVDYKPEAECFRDFGVDSVRMIIATRKCTAQEENFIVDSLKLSPEQMIIARDAVAVILNKDATDSLFTMAEIKQILTGRFKKNLIPIFDGLRATSTVRFIVDSVLKGDTLTPKAAAAKTSNEVIEYVSTHPDAVGFIGVNWIGNPEDSTQLSFLKKVKVANLESTDVPGAYIPPVPGTIYTLRYPMVRDLVYILKERNNGLGHGFASFMSGEQGQLIFKRAYLAPMQKDLRVRPAKLREE